MKLDNDFSDILHESRFERQKPMLIALFVVITIIVAISWAVFAYLGQSSQDDRSPSTDTTSSNDGKAADDASETSTVEETPSVTEEKPATSPANNSTQPTANQSNGSSSSSTYDPSKCDPLKSQADSLKTASDQKKVTYDNALPYERTTATFTINMATVRMLNEHIMPKRLSLILCKQIGRTHSISKMLRIASIKNVELANRDQVDYGGVL